MAEIVPKLFRWLGFGVIMALLPIGFSYVKLCMMNKSPIISDVIGDGGLLLTISAICARSVGELIGRNSKIPWRHPFAISFISCIKILAGVTAVCILVLSSLLFASIAEAKAASNFDGAMIASISSYMFWIGLIPCAACIILAEA